jgi:CheY-like chemotaxis protein
VMPYMDGFESCREIKSFTDFPYVVFVTANNISDDLKARISLCGGDNYQTKPVSTPHIKRILAEASNRP